MENSSPTQLRLPASARFTIRADFEGGAISSDFGAVLLRGIDLQKKLFGQRAYGKFLRGSEN